MVSRRLPAGIAIAIVVALGDGCADKDALTPVQILVRASVDVRGVRPTSAEVAAVEKDPGRLDEIVDTFVDDPRFAARAADVFAPGFRTRVDEFVFGALSSGLSEDDEAVFAHAVGEEIPNLVAYIAANDLPWTEIVRSDETFVDPILMRVWPLEKIDGKGIVPDGTVRARYVDGRPWAGALTMNAFYWRHTSTLENSNRGRGNALSKALLCKSYLDRPVDFPRDLDLTDTESIHHAIRENGACQACHATLDPIASHMWGFMNVSEDALQWAHYHPEREQQWRDATGAHPGWFGVPDGGTLRDLGEDVARDDRFVRCAVERVVASMLGRPLVVADEGMIDEHRDAFVQSGLSLKALFRSVLHDPRYRGIAARSRFGGAPAAARFKLATPEQTAKTLFALTGYSLALSGRDALSLDLGLRSVAGGTDHGSALTPSAGQALALRRVSEAGAAHVVDTLATGDSGDTGALGAALARVPLDQAPSRAVVARLVLVVRSRVVDADSADVDELLALWTEAKADGPRDAWVALLTALLADPEQVVL